MSISSVSGIETYMSVKYYSLFFLRTSLLRPFKSSSVKVLLIPVLDDVPKEVRLDVSYVSHYFFFPPCEVI